jgi:hypothetical protein
MFLQAIQYSSRSALLQTCFSMFLLTIHCIVLGLLDHKPTFSMLVLALQFLVLGVLDHKPIFSMLLRALQYLVLGLLFHKPVSFGMFVLAIQYSYRSALSQTCFSMFLLTIHCLVLACFCWQFSIVLGLLCQKPVFSMFVLTIHVSSSCSALSQT